MTAGSILFAGTSGLVSQNNSQLFWDNTNNRLGLGTTTPSASFHLVNPNNTGASPIAIFQSTGAQAPTIKIQGTDRSVTLAAQVNTLDVSGGYRSSKDGSGATNDAFSLVNSNAATTYGSLGVDSFANLVLTQSSSTRNILLSGGNVGIGTTTPAQLLSIAGNMRLTGALFDGSNASGTNGMVLLSTGTSTNWVATSSLGIAAITSLNGLTTATQTFATSTTGNDFGFSSVGSVHTLNIPDASATARGVVTTGTQTFAGVKTFSSNPIFSGLTQGRIHFSTSSGAIADSANFIWDDNLTRFGIGTSTPAATFGLKGIAGSSPLLIASSSNATLFSVIQNGNVGIGTTTPSSIFAINGARPSLTIRNSSNGQQFQLKSGVQSTTSADISLFDATNNKTIFSADGDMFRVGTTSNSIIGNSSRMFVYGGTNGANIDVMGDGGIIGGDQATLELEGSDWGLDGDPKSVLLQYQGSKGLGSTAGFANQNLGILMFSGATTTGIIGTHSANPLVFFTDYAEKARFAANGFFGLGTTSPAERLSVAGNILATGTLTMQGTATSTFNGGINLITSGGCFAINGNCVGGTGGSGITSLNGLTGSSQTFATSTTGNDFGFSSVGSVHTLNIPDASATARGVVTTGNQTFAGVKTFSSNPIFSALTQGSIPFIGASGALSQSNSQLFWDNTNSRLGLGTTSPQQKLDVWGNMQVGTSSTPTFLVNSAIGAVSIGGGTVLPNSPLQIGGNVNSYLQVNIQNRSNGGSASSDLVLTNDTGNDSINYLDIGINSSGYNDAAYTITGANDAYIYSQSHSLSIGTASSSANVALEFFTGGTLAANERMRITSTGNVGIGTTTPNQKLTVAGDALVTGTSTLATTSAASLSVSGTTTLGTANSQNGILAFQSALNSFITYLRSSSTAASNLTFTLPGTAGTSGNVLKSDGNGGMFWGAVTASGAVTLGPSSADTLNSANSGIMINQQGSGSLLQLQQGGLDKFIVANTGGLTINGATSNITKTTTADFALGTLGASLTNSNNRIEMSDGTVPNSGKGTITTAGQVTTSAALGAGALAITRPDGYYLIIRGGAGTGMDIYNSLAATTSASAQTLTGNAGAGALALPRPDGRYLVIHGGGLTTSSIVDPRGFVSVVAGPAVTASNAGTVAFKRFDGKFIYTNGGAATTQIYDIVANTVASGPSLTTGTAGAGALWLARPDGQALLVVGGATGNSQLYNQSSGTTNIGAFTAGPTLGTGCEINGAGSVAFKRQDGKYVVLSKANASTVYDPYLNTFTCSTSNGPATALGDGAHAIPMQNGNFLIIVGGNSTASYVYDPIANTYTSHGTALTAVTTGGFSLMNLDGTWQIFSGGGTASNKLDTGLPMTGSATLYTSEDISSTALSPRSTIRWTGQYEAAYVGGNAAGQSSNSAYSTLQFFVRTATSTAALSYPTVSDREIQYSGDLLRASTTDAAIRIKVQFNRVIPKRIVDERGTWTGNGSTVNRLDYATPSLFDLVVDNGAALHRGLADFALPNAAFNGAQSENSGPITTRAEATVAGVQLPYGRLPATTMISAPLTYYMGASAAANGSIPQAQTNEGTIVIARPNKTFVVIASLSTPAANAALYDPSTHSFTAQSGSNIPTAANGIGGFALKRPDGKFLVALGNSTNVTNIYDPTANTFSAGPNLTGVANTGASAIPNNDGTFTIVHGGGLLTSSLYDPVRNTMIAGPVLTTAANCGFSATPLQNGTYKVIVGAAYGAAAVATTMTYNPNTKVFVAGTNMTTAMGCGSFTFQRPDGYWLAVAAASTTATNVMNPIDGTTLAGPALTAAAYSGAHVIPRADGTFLIIHASSTAALSSIYIPQGSTFGVGSGIGTMAAGPAMPQVFGRGAVSFQRPDGKWVMIIGGASSTVNTIDTGWYADGQYLSEQMPVPALAANSILEWKQTPDNFVRIEVRASTSQASLATTPYKTLSVSGSSIENSGNETWAQVAINFRRDFPTYGLLPDVYNSGGGRTYPARTISLPTVTEYKINNGTDLMSLQNNGLNVMRVTTSGNVYTAANGGFYSGGADLAERYSSKDYLEPGDVVVSDYMINHGVKKSTGAYQEGMLGVVSTAPGFVAGAFTEDSYPIALVGRVPVKVSTENGSIKAGDYLTSASIPGYAMKATYAGRVIGKAMEDLNETNMKTCPGVAAGLREAVKCGTIMMFVTLVDYKGGSIQVAMDEWASVRNSNTALADDNGLDVLGLADTGVVANGSSTPISIGFGDVATTHDRDVLKFLKELKAEKESNLNGQSDVFAQNVHVISEVIAPKIVADIIAAREAHITNISGFQINTESLTARKVNTDALVSLSGDVGFRFTADGRMVMFKNASSTATTTTVVATSTDDTATTTDEFATSTATSTESLDFSIFGEGEVISFDVNGNAFFAGELVAKEVKTESLKVTGQTVLGGGIMVNTIGSDDSVLALLGDVEFFGRPYFNRDMGGTAIIKKDAKAVEIIFDKEYIEAPSVVASISFADEATSTLEAKESAVFDNDLKFVVTKRTTKGFVILLNKPATNDITFMWMALAIKNAQVFTSKDVATSTDSVNTFTSTNPLDTNSTSTATSTDSTSSSESSEQDTTNSTSTTQTTSETPSAADSPSDEPVVVEGNN